jgi:L-galactose dehydrogenase
VYGTTEPSEGKRAVHSAIESGINFFDSSPYYGLTLSEERLGEALVGWRDKVVLATKCGRYGLDGFDFSAARVTASIDESLRRLQTDHVDLLQAHDVEFGDVDQIIHETVPAMRKIQEQGKARYIDVSSTLVGIRSEEQVKASLKLLQVKTDPVLVEEIRSPPRADIQLCLAVG